MFLQAFLPACLLLVEVLRCGFLVGHGLPFWPLAVVLRGFCRCLFFHPPASHPLGRGGRRGQGKASPVLLRACCIGRAERCSSMFGAIYAPLDARQHVVKISAVVPLVVSCRS